MVISDKNITNDCDIVECLTWNPYFNQINNYLVENERKKIKFLSTEYLHENIIIRNKRIY